MPTLVLHPHGDPAATPQTVPLSQGDLSWLLFGLVRYALGRRTYVVSIAHDQAPRRRRTHVLLEAAPRPGRRGGPWALCGLRGVLSVRGTRDVEGHAMNPPTPQPDGREQCCEPDLDAAYWKAALEGADDACQVGIHPRAVNGVPRGPYGDGWNACARKMQERLWAYQQRCLTPDPVWRIKLEMVAAGEAFWSGTTCVLLMNDVFEWACADAEEVAEEEWPEVYRLWKELPQWGLIAWVAHKRGADPQAPVLERDEEGFRSALAAVRGGK